MQRSSSFCNNEKPSSSRHHLTPNSSRIPTPAVRNNGTTSPVVPLLRRSASLRLPSTPTSRNAPNAVDREVWGVGTGSWGKRQQLRRQGLDRSRSTVTPPVSLRGLGSSTSIDTINLRGGHNLDDDDDLCSERSYDSTMSVDRATYRSRKYVVHCGSGTSDFASTTNGASYLTPTQRTALLNKDLKVRLRQALEDVATRDREISRLTQECVELRMSTVRRLGSVSPERMRSATPSGIEKDSLNSSTHSNFELQVPIETISISSDKENEVENKNVTNSTQDSLPVLQESLLTTSNAKITLEEMENSEEKENMSNNMQQKQNLVKDINERSISVKPVIVTSKDCLLPTQNDCHLSPPSSHVQPLSLTDSGTCDEDLSLVSPPSDLVLTSPDQDSQDGELYREVLEALQTSQHSALSAATESDRVDACSQTDDTSNEVTVLKEQLNVVQETLIEAKGAQQRWPEALLSAEEAVLLWRRASLQVQLSRAKAAAESSHGDVTLQFLKSAFFHLVTGSGQGTPTATKSHWKAIQSILGFSPEECRAMDNAIAAGTFPGGSW